MCFDLGTCYLLCFCSVDCCHEIVLVIMCHVLYRDAGMIVHAATIDRSCSHVQEKMYGCEAPKCGGKIPPSQIGLGG